MTGAGSDQSGQNRSCLLNFIQPSIHVLEPGSGQGADLGAVTFAVDQVQQVPDFVQGKSERLRATNELKALPVFSRVQAIAGIAASRFRHEAAALVVAHRLQIDAGAPGQPAYGQ